jgi:mono/diheme cytochrome c family protein
MIEHRPGTRRTVFFAFLFIVIPFLNRAYAQGDPAAGGVLFKSLACNSCHAGTMIDRLTGPALYGVQDRVGDTKKIHAWIRNNQAVLATGDPYFTKLYQDNGKVPMNIYSSITDKQIDDILAYIDKTGKESIAEKAGGGGQTPSGAIDESDHSILYGILTLILAVIAMILLGINANLRKLAADREGEKVPEPIPFYRNKTYITLITLLLFVVGGFFMTKGAIKLGRQRNYQPTQPIYYSHKVHAGTNQISCLYCHGGAYEGKHANIPSANVCMNCHMTINTYKGAKIFKEDGSEVNGTTEIHKIYAAVGWDPEKRQYVGEGKPIEWVRIHSLPDHVFFNHSQHTRAGKVQCQTCHGEITAMDEVYQAADLSMGWCVNCHRESKVQFVDNKFYSIYEKLHNDIKSGKMDSVTVEQIGGTECQKCHY